jgi:hypothetical protein
MEKSFRAVSNYYIGEHDLNTIPKDWHDLAT